jgi:transposase
LSTIYKRKSRLTAQKQGRLLEYFVAGISARAASELVGVQPNTAISFFMRLRQLISSRMPSYILAMDIHHFDDEDSVWGNTNAGKIVVFGLLLRNGKIHVAIIPNENAANLQPVYPEMVLPEYVFFIEPTQTSRIFFLSDLHFKCTTHSNMLDSRKNHLIGIEKFWYRARKHMQKFNGVRLDNFYWFLKEYEWRFNGGNHKQLLEQLRSWYRS